MPDIFVLTASPIVKDVLKQYVCEDGALSTKMRKVTSAVFGLNNEKATIVYLIKAESGDNVPDVQILCICTHSPERQEKLKAWCDELAATFQSFYEQHIKDRVEKPWTAQAWPIMPLGEFKKIILTG